MWSSIKKHCVLIAAALLAAIPLTARAAEATEFNARIIANKTSVAAGQTIKLGVEFKIPAGKHIYFREAGDTGRPTTVEFALPDGSRVASLIWPRPLRIEDGGFVCFGYHDKTVISAEVTLPAAINGSTLNLHAKVSWLLCGDGSCMPGETELDLQLPVVSSASLSNDSPEAKSLNYKAFEGNVSEINANVPDLETATTQVQQIELQTLSLPYLLLLSFAAGLLLNLMPCVLPVLALKVMSLSKQAGQDRSVSLKLGAAYTLGTLATFAALATAMVAARSLGSSLGWGFQFQSLGYLVVMCSVICLMTLSIFGLFFVQIQTGVQELETVASKNGLLSAFARGISATLLSTPCSAPLLGTALGFALSQPAAWIFAVLLTVGFGLAFPYLLLSCFPTWLKFLPKPGEWMDRFKEAMGFLMLGTLVWMLSVVAQVGGAAALIGTLVFLFCLVLATWSYVRFAPDGSSLLRKVIVIALALSLVATSFYRNIWTLPAKGEQVHVGLHLEGVKVAAYSQDELERQLAAGNIVFVDVTAEWCLTCKMNEAVLGSSSVLEAMRLHKVVVLQADWTRGQENVTAFIKSFGRPGVPMYVIYSPNGKTPVLLPELITPGIVTDAIRDAAR